MNDIITINDKQIRIKEYKGQRVVTFKDIDEVHQRPEGTARRNFNENKHRFIEGIDYFVRNSYEAKEEFGITAPNGLVLITESGYLMLVKSFTDDLSWQVQRQLVNTYFRAKELVQPMTQIQILQQAVNILAEHEQKLLALEEKQQILQYRIENLDAVNIEGDLQQRLNKLIRKYAFKNGIRYDVAWEHFKQAYNTAFRTNLELLINNYKAREGIKKLTIPQYLAVTGRLEDALRV
nr:hypothetical protein [Clostridia bacterium]